ncbi:MAG: sulfotransferase [Planctomycetota bacterium]
MRKRSTSYYWRKLRGHNRLRNQAVDHFETGQFEQAATLVAKGRSRFPDSDVFRILAAKLAMLSDRREEARQSLSGIVLSRYDRVEDCLEAGEIFRRLGDYDRAVDWFELAASEGGVTATHAYRVLASLLLRSGRYDQALRAALDGLKGGGWNSFAVITSLADNCSDDGITSAIDELEHFHCADPYLNANRLKMLAYFNLAAGRKQDAIDSIGRATRTQYLVDHPDGGWDDSVARLKPSFLVIGAMKSGTTAIYNHLARHPQVCPPLTKELHFFENGLYPSGFYFAQFPRVAGNVISGEASPGYYALDIAARVRELLPDVKLIFIRRDPVDRAISHLFHNHRAAIQEHPSSSLKRGTRRILELTRQSPAELATALKHVGSDELRVNHYLLLGCYDLLLRSWYQHFPADRILNLEFETFVSQPQATMDRVFEFLEIEPFELAELSSRKERNAGQYQTDDATLEEIRTHLREFYERVEINLRRAG